MSLLDTNIIIAILRGKQEIVNKYQFISSKDQLIYIATYSIAEIYIGFQDQEYKHKNLKKLSIQKTLFSKMVNYLDAQKRVISLKIEDAKILGRLLYKLKTSGKPIPLIDAILSAIGISRDLMIITSDKNHFKVLKTIQDKLKVDFW